MHARNADARPPSVAIAPRAVLPLGPWLPAIVGALCFIGTLANDFTYDDVPIIRQGTRLHNVWDFRTIWMSDWWYETNANEPVRDPNRDRLWRPLTLHTFAVNYAIHGLSTVGFHAGNVLLHAASCALVCLLARRLMGDQLVATVAGLIFAVHPIHAEAVAGVVGRAEVLAALLILAGLVALAPNQGAAGFRRVALSLPAFLGALFAKETAICFPALALLTIHFVDRSRGHTRALRSWAIVAALLVSPLLIYFPARFAALESRIIRDRPTSAVLNPLFEANTTGRAIGALTVLGHYTRIMLVPANLCSDYGLAVIRPNGSPGGHTALGAAAAIGLALLALGYFRRGNLARQLGYCAIAFIASYALISNTILLIGVSMAERLFYWPSVPLVLGAATALVAGYRRAAPADVQRAQWLQAGGAALLVALAARSAVRGYEWRDNRTLFESDVATQPESVQALISLGLVAIDDAQSAPDLASARAAAARAVEMLDRAAKIHPGVALAMRLRGDAARILGDRETAMRYLESALQLNPTDRVAASHLAELRSGGEARTKLEELRAAVAKSPDDAKLRAEFAAQLVTVGRPEEAYPQFEAALKLLPDDPDLLRDYAAVAAVVHKKAEAIEALRRALKIRADDWQVHSNLSALLSESDPAATLLHAERAVLLQPNDLRVQSNLAEALELNGRRADAIARLKLIIRGLKSGDPMRAAIEGRLRKLEHGP